MSSDDFLTKCFLDGSNVIADYDGNNSLLATYITPGTPRRVNLDDNLSQTRDSAVLAGDLPVAPTGLADGLGPIRNLHDGAVFAVPV